MSRPLFVCLVTTDLRLKCSADANNATAFQQNTYVEIVTAFLPQPVVGQISAVSRFR